jgi:DNA (cytosine-5)-methyltransferase 1
LTWKLKGTKYNRLLFQLAAKNAPHRRDRCWFIGVRNATNTNCNGFQQRNCDDEINASERRINAFGNANKIPSDWEKFPTQSPICGGDDGLPTELDGITFSKWRAESIKGYGNAIVPQVALELFKVIQEIDNQLI